MTRTLSFKCTDADADVADWYDQIPSGERSELIREAIRARWLQGTTGKTARRIEPPIAVPVPPVVERVVPPKPEPVYVDEEPTGPRIIDWSDT